MWASSNGPALLPERSRLDHRISPGTATQPQPPSAGTATAPRPREVAHRLPGTLHALTFENQSYPRSLKSPGPAALLTLPCAPAESSTPLPPSTLPALLSPQATQSKKPHLPSGALRHACNWNTSFNERTRGLTRLGPTGQPSGKHVACLLPALF